jgi:putative nucleotidyltransferase with HDIG domain
MRTAIRWYVASVLVAAGVAGLAVYAIAPEPPQGSLTAVCLLSALALLAELLGFLLPRAARGSLSFTAYVAMGVLVPAWPAVLAVFFVKTAMGIVQRTAPHKAVFNVGSHVVALSAEILVYRLLGGVSLLVITPATLLRVTVLAGVPATAAFVTSYIANTALVCGAIALEARASIVAIWRELKLATVGLDLLISPAIFVFAWVYAAFGAIAAATLWIPLLGLRQLHKTNLEMEQTNQELLELMVKSLEARDPYTSGHSRRVRQFSITIARAIGLPAAQVEQIGRAALLHDVGKIHEKYAPILSKTEKLSPDEWVTMKEHPVDGANLVATMSRLRDVVPAIRGHHENWDGTGYPDGLAGEGIPLAARIIRFADTIDAMTTDRPYRRPLTETDVRGELVRCRGTQFDPAITDNLLSSALWPTLFTPDATDRTIIPISVVTTSPRTARTVAATKALREA